MSFLCLVGVGGLLNAVVLCTPPWLANDGIRSPLLPSWLHSVLSTDPDPLGAFPSLHVLVTASFAYYARSRVWLLLAVCTSLAVLTLGEHWVTDVFASWALVGLAVVLSDSRVYRALWFRQDARNGHGSREGAAS